MTSDEGRVRGPAILVALLCAGHFLAFFDRFLLAASAPLVADAFAMDDATMGLLLGPAFALCYGIAALLVGRFASDRGRRVVLAGGIAVWTAGAIGIGLAGSVPALAVARMAVGVGQAAFAPLALTLLVDSVSGAGRGRALSFFTAGSTLGRGFALLGGGGLLALLSWWQAPVALWRMLYFLTGLPNLLLLAALLPVLSKAGPAQRKTARLWPWLTRNAALAGGVTTAGIASIAATQAVAAWLPTLTVRRLAVGVPAAAAMIGAVTLVTSPAGQLLGGLLVDRVAVCRRRPVALLGVTLVAALPALAIVAAATTRAVLLAGAGIVNLLLGASTFAGLFAVQEICPPALRRAANPVYLALVTMIGAGLGPALAGLAARGEATQGLGGALVVTVAVCAVAAFAGAALAKRDHGQIRTLRE